MKLHDVRNFLVLCLLFSTSQLLPAATTNIVQIGNFFFSPKNLNITNGDSVIWMNISANSHDSTSSNGVWATGVINAGASSSAFKFSTPGLYPYHCQTHQFTAPQQNGTVNVAATPNVRPTVLITNPVNNASFTAPATFKIEAQATDSDGSVSQVQFTGPGGSSITDTTTPFNTTAVDVAAGNYTITAVATDNNGGKDTNSITIVVRNPPSPVTLATPAIGSTNIAFSFLSESGRTYTVEFKSQVDAALWQTLTSFVANGTNATVSDTNTNAQRFYRVGAQ
jgi:plastocyanin